ncbi:hypothetical protein DPMN_024095 [Dreissena polymorpha]|uniref:Uncharacterized protein n=1 Tax=Dreissena polymorpha TaxID=45954 RepID=A0A9D4RBZ5_DREPO|nr:hypothetical protein DPMN_024095 [Dreissena polymorpha]
MLFSSTSELVVTPSQHFKGQVFSVPSSNKDIANRCKHICLGCLFGKFDNTRSLVPIRQTETYQLPRNEGGFSSNVAFSSTIEKSSCSNSIRQYNGSSISEQTRGNTFNISMYDNMENLAVSNKREYSNQSSSHCAETECSTRSVIKNSNSTNRMDFEQICSASTFSNLGVSVNRPVCITSEQTDTDILFMNSSSNSFGIGCVDNFMGRDVRLCISLDMPYSESATVHTTIQMHNTSNSPILAQTPQLLQLAIAHPIKLPENPNLLCQPQFQILHPNPRVFQLVAWLLSTDTLQQQGFQKKLENYLDPVGGQAHKLIIMPSINDSVAGVHKGKLIHLKQL